MFLLSDLSYFVLESWKGLYDLNTVYKIIILYEMGIFLT